VNGIDCLFECAALNIFEEIGKFFVGCHAMGQVIEEMSLR
jgi:hypothetical protein